MKNGFQTKADGSQKTNTNGQETLREMLNTVNHQRNVNHKDFHLPPVIMARISKTDDSSCWRKYGLWE